MPTFKPSTRIYSSHNSTLMTEQTNIKQGLYQRNCLQKGQKRSPVKCCGSPTALFYFTLTVINSYPLSYRVFSPSCDLKCKVKLTLVKIISKRENKICSLNTDCGFVHILWQMNQRPWEVVVKWNCRRGEHHQFCTYYCQEV